VIHILEELCHAFMNIPDEVTAKEVAALLYPANTWNGTEYALST
jgi:hypothetical protein